jgi:thioredoxin 1
MQHMAEGIVNLSTGTFDEHIQSADKPVVVDFWAEWCGPCRVIAPILDEIATERGDEITIAKVNADDNPELVLRYGVQSIPTLLVFSNGNLSKRVIGARGKTQLLQELDEFLVSVP